MKGLADLELGPVFGWTTREGTRLWVRGRPRTQAIVRWRAGGTASGLWRHGAIGLAEQLDWTGTLDLPFDASHDSLCVEAALIAQSDDASRAPEFAWDTLSEASRGCVRKPPLSTDGFSFVLGSCRHRGYGPWRQGDQAFETLLAADQKLHSDFLMLCGDQVYCDHPLNSLVPILPAVLANRTPESQKGYFECYRNDFAARNFRNALRTRPVYMIFDDHEISNNWAGYRIVDGDGPVERFKHTVKQATWEWGMQAYLAYQAAHSPALGALAADALLPDGAKTRFGAVRHWWYQFSWGIADFFVLDTRSDRTDPQGASPAMIGAVQYAALKAFLRSDDGRYKFVVSPVPIAPDTNQSRVAALDTWRAYPGQRRDLLDFIAKEAPQFPIFLGGDLHLSRMVAIKSDGVPGFFVPSIMSSALNWFVFGVQERGLLGCVLPRLEEGRLPSSLAEIGRSAHRAGPYRVENLSAAVTRNNFIHLHVEVNRVLVRIVRAGTGEVVGQCHFNRNNLINGRY